MSEGIGCELPVHLKDTLARENKKKCKRKCNTLPADDPRVVAAIADTMERFKGAWKALADK